MIVIFNWFDNEIIKGYEEYDWDGREEKKGPQNWLDIKTKRSKKKSIYDISEIDFINVVCLVGNASLLLVSLSNVVVVTRLVHDDEDVCWHVTIGGSISQFFDGGFIFASKSSLFVKIKSSTTRCLAEDGFWLELLSSTS